VSSCSDEQRPEQADLSVEDARRVLAGSFSSPDTGAPLGAQPPGGSGGGASASADAGAAAASASTLRKIYQGECEEPGRVQWGFLTYVANTPGDSEVVFRLRSAPTSEALEHASFRELIRASSALGTRLCAVTGPAPCPIDLFVALDGAPLVYQPFSELELALEPSSTDGAMPSVEEWKLTYSCTFQ
jgi:hypothetical protein